MLKDVCNLCGKMRDDCVEVVGCRICPACEQNILDCDALDEHYPTVIASINLLWSQICASGHMVGLYT
ncbi:MAG: sigma factor G inhibitor Gin [Christensenellales bacterium]|jgi:hypothetical protein